MWHCSKPLYLSISGPRESISGISSTVSEYGSYLFPVVSNIITCNYWTNLTSKQQEYVFLFTWQSQFWHLNDYSCLWQWIWLCEIKGIKISQKDAGSFFWWFVWNCVDVLLLVLFLYRILVKLCILYRLGILYLSYPIKPHTC